ncbi:unnamed protein product, partial [Prorocentrum cordatum]
EAPPGEGIAMGSPAERGSAEGGPEDRWPRSSACRRRTWRPLPSCSRPCARRAAPRRRACGTGGATSGRPGRRLPFARTSRKKHPGRCLGRPSARCRRGRGRGRGEAEAPGGAEAALRGGLRRGPAPGRVPAARPRGGGAARGAAARAGRGRRAAAGAPAGGRRVRRAARGDTARGVPLRAGLLRPPRGRGAELPLLRRLSGGVSGHAGVLRRRPLGRPQVPRLRRRQEPGGRHGRSPEAAGVRGDVVGRASDELARFRAVQASGLQGRGEEVPFVLRLARRLQDGGAAGRDLVV